MLARVAVLTLVAGGTACALLAQRQSRLQVASEVAQAQLRITSADERLWVMRAEVGRRVTPGEVQRMASALGPMRPIMEFPVVTGEVGRRVAEGEPGFVGPPRPPRSSSRTNEGSSRVAQRRVR
jgi:hypothetical protein